MVGSCLKSHAIRHCERSEANRNDCFLPDCFGLRFRNDGAAGFKL